MEVVLLTSENFVRSQTNISNNVQSKFLIAALREAQDIHLQQILGTRLVEYLIKLVKGEKQSVDPYTQLIVLSQYYLAYKAISILCVSTSFHIDNAGIVQCSDENLTSATLKDVMQLSQYYTDKADFYAKRIQDYIRYCISENALPEVIGYSKYEINANVDNNVSCGLNLGNVRGKQNRTHNHYYNYDKQ